MAYAPPMRSLLGLTLVACLLGALPAHAQTQPLPLGPGTKYRVRIDSSPQQAAIYVEGKQYGIQGYTPSVLRLPKGSYKVIIELPGFKPMERQVDVRRAGGTQPFLFTLERAVRPAVLDIRSTSGDSASGGQLFVDGTAAGTVPGRAELPAGKHVVEVKKPGFKDFRDTIDAQEGDTRTMIIELVAEAKKGSILVTADIGGADVYVDGTRRDAAPTLVADLVEGDHTVEVRKDPLPPFRQVVRVVGNAQQKVEARFSDKLGGTLRVVSSVPNADVVLDGELKGKVNTDIQITRPGQHIVELRVPGMAGQSQEITIAQGESRVIKMDPQGPSAPNPNLPPPLDAVGRLRVVTPEPDAEVFVDGSSMGIGSMDRRDIPAGKHFVVVRKQGFAEWKREVELKPGESMSLTADLASSGTLKVLANVTGAEVFVDGQAAGTTPVTVPNVSAGDHLVEVRAPGFHEARQQLHLGGGEQKVLSADLQPRHEGPSPQDMIRRIRASSSFSAVTLDPGRFTFDLGVGFIPFAEARLTVGAWRKGMFGIDAGVGVRTDGYLTEVGVHAKAQLLRAGPVAIGTQFYLGGGGGPGGRNDFTFEWGLPISLLFGEIVRVTGNPYLQVATDRLCPTSSTPTVHGGGESDICSTGYGAQPAGQTNYDARWHHGTRDRFVSARLMLQAAIEVSVHRVATVFFIFEGAPTGERASLSGHGGYGYNDGFAWKHDPQLYGRLGVTFKF